MKTICPTCSREIKIGEATYSGTHHWECRQQEKKDAVEDVIKACNTLPKAHDMIRRLMSRGPFG